MALYKNKNFTKRNYECMNKVFCIAPTPPDENWVPAEEADVPAGMQQLYREGDAIYYGWL